MSQQDSQGGSQQLFEEKYVAANNQPDAPNYDADFMARLESSLINTAPELAPIANALLTALAVGAHRADIVPRLLNHALANAENETTARRVFEQFRSAIMVVWPFVGIPWCVPACLGMFAVLESRNLLWLAEGRTRPDLDVAVDRRIGSELMGRTYAAVQNTEVRQMLQRGFGDFSDLTWTVVFGYSLAGTTATGIFQEHQTQLLLASAIASAGATRQARSHLKGAWGLGNSARAVKAVYAAASTLNAWNGVRIADVDVDELLGTEQAPLGTEQTPL